MQLIKKIINLTAIVWCWFCNHQLRWHNGVKISAKAYICNGGQIELCERSEVRAFAVLSPGGGKSLLEKIAVLVCSIMSMAVAGLRLAKMSGWGNSYVFIHPTTFLMIQNDRFVHKASIPDQ